MSAFDPTAWLEQYVALGGWYVVDGEQRVTMGWSLEGDGLTVARELQSLFMEAKGNPEHSAALIAHILSRQRIPA